jgi:UDP-2,3-diacylglucosamine pyrophosphatase LpxH
MLLASDLHFGHNNSQDVEALAEIASDTPRTGGIAVICGDFTSTGRSREYEQARELLERIIAAGNVVVVTPGNHDFGIPGVGIDHVNWIPRLNKAGRKRFWEHLMPLVLAQRAVIAHSDFDTIIRHGDDVFVALRSTHIGIRGINRIKGAQIDWATRALHGLTWNRLWFVTHRSIWSDPQHGPMSKRKRLEKRLFREFSFDGFIHGHNHNVVFQRTTTPKLGIQMLHVGVPTLSTRSGSQNRSFLLWDAASKPQLMP